MSPHLRERLLSSIRKHEGCRLTAYLDTVGVATIGFGCTRYYVTRSCGPGWTIEPGTAVALGDSISEEQAEAELEVGLDTAIVDLTERFPWVSLLPEPAYEALVEMSYQLGIGRLANFKKMLEAVRTRHWGRAIVEAYDSKWSRQTPARFEHVARLFAQADDALR